MLFLKHDDDNVEDDDANNVIDDENGSDDYHDVFSNGNLLQALTASFLVMDPLSSLSISLKIRWISSSLIYTIIRAVTVQMMCTHKYGKQKIDHCVAVRKNRHHVFRRY